MCCPPCTKFSHIPLESNDTCKFVNVTAWQQPRTLRWWWWWGKGGSVQTVTRKGHKMRDKMSPRDIATWFLLVSLSLWYICWPSMVTFPAFVSMFNVYSDLVVAKAWIILTSINHVCSSLRLHHVYILYKWTGTLIILLVRTKSV